MQTLIEEVEIDRNKEKEVNEHQKQLIEIQINEMHKIEFELQEQVGSYF